MIFLWAAVLVNAVMAKALLPVVPQPTSWTPSKAGSFAIPETLTVSGTCPAAFALARDWRLGGGRSALVPDGAAVSVAVDPASALCEEGYRLTVNENSVAIVAETETGAYWATRTLLQLLRRGKPLACGVIEDYPKYRYRGFMLDVARKPYSLSFLRALVKNMAYYKFNVFHIHLNDDGSNAFVSGYSRFRLECETCPELTAKDGHYTKADFRAFVKEAATMGVVVIPEIDTPAHAGAITAVHPEFASDKYGRTHLDLHNPAAAAFVERLYDEYLGGDDPVFAGPYFHVGTDEYDKREAEAFRAYTDRMLRSAMRYGKTPCAWGALTHAKGQTPVVAENVVMDLWYNGYYDPKEALSAGYKIVAVPSNFLYLVPTTNYYFDYLDCKRLFYEWEPCVIGDVVLPADHPQLLGGKFALWNDISGNGISEDDTFDRVFPAMQVLSQKMWSGKVPDENWDAFSIFSASAGEAPGLNMADRLTGPGQTATPLDRAVGWSQKDGYRVFFELKPEKERESRVLFDDGYSRVGLYDGKIGFEREGFRHVWDCVPSVDRWSPLTFVGTSKGVSLSCDGRDFGFSEGAKGCCTNWCGSGRTVYFLAPRTLHFPLVAADGAKSCVRRFVVTVGTERKTSPLEASIAADHVVIASEWRREGHRILFEFKGRTVTIDEPLEANMSLLGHPWSWRTSQSDEQVAELQQAGCTVVTVGPDVAKDALVAYLTETLGFDVVGNFKPSSCL